MRIVIDSNQLVSFLDKIDRTDAYQRVTLAPYVFVDVMLHPHAQKLITRLRSFDILVGHEPSDALAGIAGLDEEDIRAFTPYNGEFELPIRLTRKDVSIAQNVKERHRVFGANMFNRAQLFRNHLRNEGLKDKFSGFSEALELLGPSFFQSFVFNSISYKGSRPLTVSDEKTLYTAVMDNRYFSRYFRMIFFYIISYSRMWKNQTQNFDPSDRVDDWTDITLPFYAADGDIILTADKKLRAAIGAVEASDAVHVRTAQEL